MKPYLTILFFFTSHLLSAQINLKNSSLTTPDSALLYFGLDNKIEIIGIPFQPSIKFTSTNSDLKVENDKIVLEPKLLGVDTIRVYKGKFKIFEKTFKITRLDTPVIQIAYSIDSFLNKERIIAQPYVSLKIPNCFYKFRTVVYSYQLEIVTRGQEPIKFNMTTSEISNDALTVIQTLKHGDKLYFENIKGGVQSSFCPRSYGGKIITIR